MSKGDESEAANDNRVQICPDITSAEEAAVFLGIGRRQTFEMRGAPVRTIQELAGHASITTTMGYLHLTPNAAREAIALLESPAIATLQQQQGAL